MISYQYVEVKPLKSLKKRQLNHALKKLVDLEGFVLQDLSIVFCSDDYLLGVNRSYLKHDYFTDIITFDYSAQGKLNGDLFISIDRVMENHEAWNTTFGEELLRVVFHGVLHLCGYKDKSPKEKQIMRNKENLYLDLFVSRETKNPLYVSRET